MAPKPEQLPLVEAALNLNRAAIFAGLGVGKTFVGSTVLWNIFKRGYLSAFPAQQRALIVCPKSVIGEWVKQPPQFMDCKVKVFPDDMSIDGDFVVTNFEQVEKLIPYRKHFGAVIIDESHNVKSVHTKRFDDIMQFCDAHIQVRFILTGTPIVNRPDDLFSQLSFINPYAFNFSFDFMMSRYFRESGRGARAKIIFKSAGKGVFESITSLNSFLLASDSSDRLPSEKELRKFRVSSEQARYLDAVQQGHVTTLDAVDRMAPLATAENKRMQTIELKNALVKESQVSSGFLQAGDKVIRFRSDKLIATHKLVTGDWKDEQVIVWVYFRETAERLQTAFGNEAVTILGGMSTKARMDAKNAFESGRKRILIAQLKAGNAGLNLQFCAHAVFAELDWAPTTVDQAVGRIDRRNQTRACKIVFMYTIGTTDELMLAAYNNKMTVSSAVLKNFIKTRNIKGSFTKTKRANPHAISAEEKAVYKMYGVQL